jgi:hypothetical protein
MANLIDFLFGGRQRPPDPDPLPGVGGYAMPPGPYGATGLPGSTIAAPHPLPQTLETARLPRRIGGPPVRGTQTTRASYRGDQPPPGQPGSAPYDQPQVTTPRSGIVDEMQTNSPREFYGGLALKSGPGNHIQGQPGRASAAEGGHDTTDTTTPYSRAQSQISQGVPGAQNVRNTTAQRYKNAPGGMHTYLSASRPDQANPNEDMPGWASEGGGNYWRTAGGITVPNRFVYGGGGHQTWAVMRRMPYTSAGDGGRGAHLNGQRYYGVGGYDNFANAGQGAYGTSRLSHRMPVSFTEPAPWQSNVYVTTPEVGTTEQPGPQSQAPYAVVVSPGSSRAPNTSRRRGY